MGGHAGEPLIGHLQVLEWCRVNGDPWNEGTCSNAAGQGHLEVLHWCRVNGCSWDKWKCTRAAAEGHQEVLKWCRANGFSWNEQTWATATIDGGTEMKERCRANDCPFAENSFVESGEWLERVYRVQPGEICCSSQLERMEYPQQSQMCLRDSGLSLCCVLFQCVACAKRDIFVFHAAAVDIQHSMVVTKAASVYCTVHSQYTEYSERLPPWPLT